MQKVLKWIGIVLGVLVLLVALAALGIYLSSEAMVTKTYSVTPEVVKIPTDAAAIKNGERLTKAYGCADCHTNNLGGGLFIPEPLGPIYAANITPGGVGKKYTDADYVRAIRHGVNPSGRGLIVMPSQEYYGMSDEDLGAIIAYLKVAPPVTNETPAPQVGPVGRVLFVLGAVPAPAASQINHTAARPVPPKFGATVEYGSYLANMTCIGCHRADMAGGTLPGAQPNDPLALNLTSGGELAKWSEADFAKAMRTGVVPSGRTLSDHMPWKNLGNMNDDELKAIYLYLKSLPAKPQNTK